VPLIVHAAAEAVGTISTRLSRATAVITSIERFTIRISLPSVRLVVPEVYRAKHANRLRRAPRLSGGRRHGRRVDG